MDERSSSARITKFTECLDTSFQWCCVNYRIRSIRIFAEAAKSIGSLPAEMKAVLLLVLGFAAAVHRPESNMQA